MALPATEPSPDTRLDAFGQCVSGTLRSDGAAGTDGLRRVGRFATFREELRGAVGGFAAQRIAPPGLLAFEVGEDAGDRLSEELVAFEHAPEIS